MLWFKALHIIFVVTWFAGLFYLPRLFVYHAMTRDEALVGQYRIMQRRLMMITHIGGALALLFGILTLLKVPAMLQFGWMHAKLFLVLCLVAYHLYCAHLVRQFATGHPQRSHRWYRWFNELPALFLITIVILVVVKPF